MDYPFFGILEYPYFMPGEYYDVRMGGKIIAQLLFASLTV
jgi:hypothetical protein